MKPMIKAAMALATASFLGSGAAQAALYDRGGGLLYDDVLNVTWLQDANYAKTSGYDADGRMDWTAAKNWAGSLAISRFAGESLTGWRLPAYTPLRTDGGVYWTHNGSGDVGYNITNPRSELSYMYYVNLGLKGYFSPTGVVQPDWGIFRNATSNGTNLNSNGQNDVGQVRNLQSRYYWSGTSYSYPYVFYPEDREQVWTFNPGSGEQYIAWQGGDAYSWAVRSGDVAKVPTPSPKNIVVITHGWNSSTTGLPEIKAAVTQRLTNEGKLADTLVKDFRWPQADTGISYIDPLSNDPKFDQAVAHTQYAGLLLADELARILAAGKALDPNYDPTIHLIGHSLGTRVNSFAAQALSGLTTIEQVTILDAPLKSPASFYYETMTAGTVKYVDNYIAGDIFAGGSKPGRFGAPIAGTGPCTVATGKPICIGVWVEGQNHVTLAKTWYPGVVNSAAWKSPVLSGWVPDILWDPAAVSQNRGPSLLKYFAANFNDESLDVLAGTVRLERGVGDTSIITLTPNSPVSFGLDLLVPEQAVLLTFDLEMTKASMGEVQVKINEEDVWFWYGGDLDNPSVTAEIDVSTFAGTAGRLVLTYTPHGALDQARISNLQFGVSPVPELPMWALFLVGLIGIAARQFKRPTTVHSLCS